MNPDSLDNPLVQDIIEAELDLLSELFSDTAEDLAQCRQALFEAYSAYRESVR